MTYRAELPQNAMSITPGFSWRLDLDVKFGGVRPSDWPAWFLRLHVWGAGIQLKLTNGAGLTFEPVEIETAPGVFTTITLPVFKLTGTVNGVPGQTEQFRDKPTVNYLIDLRAPAGQAEDYFAGKFNVYPTVPASSLL